MEYAPAVIIWSTRILRAGHRSLEDMPVAADPDPYFALPSLYGAPAYARPPKVVRGTERPPDPDDLPIAVEQTDEERAIAQALQANGPYRGLGGLTFTGAPYASNGFRVTTGSAVSGGTSPAPDAGGRRFGLRALTDRLGPRTK